jgi:hypothetical protein
VTSRVSDRGEGPSEGMGGIHSNTSAEGEDNPSSAAPHIGEMDVQDDASVVFSEQPGSDAASRSDSFDHSQLDYGADDEDAAGFMGDRLFCHGVSDSAVDSHQLMVFQGSINVIKHSSY